MASSPQSWNWLENRRSKDNKASRRVWEAVETKAEEAKVAKAEKNKNKNKKPKRRE